MLSHDSSQPKQTSPHHLDVEVDLQIEAGETRTRTSLPSSHEETVCSKGDDRDVTSTRLTSNMEKVDLLDCPLCDFTVLPTDDYVLRLHFEQVHTTDSPFIIEDDPEPLPPPLPARPSSTQSKHTTDTPSLDDDENSVLCPEPDCGEVILLTDFNDHLDYHAAETLSFDETTGKYRTHSSTNMHGLTATAHSMGSLTPSFLEHDFSTDLPNALRRAEDASRKLKKKTQRGRSDTSGSDKSTISRSILAFNPFVKPDKRIKPPASNIRLGKSELGPHAWEDRMPRWLHDQLAAGPKITVVNRIGRDGRLLKQEQVQNETPGIIPILAQLSALDRSVKEAYYCHPSTLHIGKTPREGGFCGYRNIQMLISYIQGTKAQGFEEFPGRTPGILKLQDLIERAWDKNINEIGRKQTGGIKDTRKYIGTPEVQALFLSSQIDCAVEMFCDLPNRQAEAHEMLLLAVERYFLQAAVSDGSNVYKTLLPPIYLQQPGHSITIIGFERRRDGSCNLMVFDPMYNTSPAMHRLLGRKNIKTARPEVLYTYRRVAKQLRKHASFEVLMLTAHPPLYPAWDVLRQFPDCRFLYVFFRSRTLGYDVYPEDHFLRNFPWQEYGGLWMVDDARFARSEKMNVVTAQTLRRITSEGASNGTTTSNCMTSSFNSGSFHQPSPPDLRNLRIHDPPTRVVSCMPSFDGSMCGLLNAVSSNSVFDMIGMAPALPQLETHKTDLSRLTDVGRRYPGYPSPLSSTLNAKTQNPSPVSEAVGGAATLRARSPGVRVASPMSIDGSEMCGPSRRCLSHGYEHYSSTMRLFDDASDSEPLVTRAPSVVSPTQLYSPPRSPSIVSLSPTSPSSPISPRTAMLKNMYTKQNFQSLSHQTNFLDTNKLLQFNTNTINGPQCQPQAQPSSSTCPSSPGSPSPPVSQHSIHIANGTITNIISPISPSGTMLAYTSNRTADSGLLAVRPLSEAQVAEYRFWRPCGRRVCAFGCGEGNEGELAAAKRLFKNVEEVRPETVEDVDGETKGTDAS